MRPQSIGWERAAEIRDAADGWRRAGAIGAPTHAPVMPESARQYKSDPVIITGEIDPRASILRN